MVFTIVTDLWEMIVTNFTTKNSARLVLLLFVTLSVFSCNTEINQLTIRVRSRLYPAFKEDHAVKMYQKFPISDTDMEAVVIDFYPDFAIDTLSHKAFSKSDTLRNPAAKLLIIENNEKKEEVWAFPPGMMPHFSPKSFIGFELVDFKTGSKYVRPSAGLNRGMENE